MFKLANCNDLITLKCKYPNFIFTEENSWGLKQMGSLFCIDKIMETKAKTILEVGGGLNLFYERNFGIDYDYWMIDKSGFYDSDKFQSSLANRKNTSYVDSLMGDFNDGLSNNYFDIIFSISVLEHSPRDMLCNICKDMYRVLKPGGYIAHSIDLGPKASITLGNKFLESLQNSGFIFEQLPSDLDWKFDDPEKITLLEPLSIVYKYYGGKKEDVLSNPKTVTTHFGTLLVCAKKPE